MSYSASYTSVANGWNTFVSETLPRDMHVCQNHLHVLITEKILQNKPCLLISSTPPNFFLKSTAIPFPILTSSLIQCASEWEVGQENRSPFFSSNLKPCQTNITVVYLHSYITIVCCLCTFINTINNSNMCGILILYT